MINTSTDTHAPNASSSNSTGLAADCLSPSIAVSSPPAFTPVNFNPLFQFSFTIRSLIQHLSQISHALMTGTLISYLSINQSDIMYQGSPTKRGVFLPT